MKRALRPAHHGADLVGQALGQGGLGGPGRAHQRHKAVEGGALEADPASDRHGQHHLVDQTVLDLDVGHDGVPVTGVGLVGHNQRVSSGLRRGPGLLVEIDHHAVIGVNKKQEPEGRRRFTVASTST
jgi:hypothetical protein